MADPLPPLHDPDEPGTRVDESSDEPFDRTRNGVGAGRHVSSVVLCLLLVPAAYVLLDYATIHAREYYAVDLGESVAPTRALLTAAIGGVCLFLATAAGRMSALGPLLAGLAWGAGLSVWVYLDYPSFARRLEDLPNLYDDFGLGLFTASFALFPATGALLIGTAVAGRWKGSRG